MSATLELPHSAEELFKASYEDVSNKMQNDPFKQRLENLLVDLAPEDQNKPPPTEEKNEEWKARVRAMVDDAKGVKDAVRMLEPIVSDQSTNVDHVREMLIQENDQSMYGAQQANVLGESYNAAAPVSNGIYQFLHDVDTATHQSSKVADFEGQEDGQFDTNMNEAAAAVTMIAQVIDNLQDVVVPKMVQVNLTTENLYNSSDRVSEIFNSNARRLQSLKDREAMLSSELDKAKTVMTVLIEYTTQASADMHVAAAKEEAAAGEEGTPASLLQTLEKGGKVPPITMQALREWQAKRHRFTPTALAVEAVNENNISASSFKMDLPTLAPPKPFPKMRDVPQLAVKVAPSATEKAAAPAPPAVAPPSGIIERVESAAAGLWQEVTSIGPWRRLG